MADINPEGVGSAIRALFQMVAPQKFREKYTGEMFLTPGEKEAGREKRAETRLVATEQRAEARAIGAEGRKAEVERGEAEELGAFARSLGLPTPQRPATISVPQTVPEPGADIMSYLAGGPQVDITPGKPFVPRGGAALMTAAMKEPRQQRAKTAIELATEAAGERYRRTPSAQEVQSELATQAGARAGAVEGGKLAQPEKMSDKEQDELNEYRDHIASVQGIRANYNKEFVGPMQGGLLGSAREGIPIGFPGALSAPEAGFRQAVRTAEQYVRKPLYGSALTGTELSISRNTIPYLGMGDQQFRASLDAQEAIQNWKLGMREAVLSSARDPRTQIAVANEYRRRVPFPVTDAQAKKIMLNQFSPAEVMAVKEGKKPSKRVVQPGKITNSEEYDLYFQDE